VNDRKNVLPAVHGMGADGECACRGVRDALATRELPLGVLPALAGVDEQRRQKRPPESAGSARAGGADAQCTALKPEIRLVTGLSSCTVRSRPTTRT
jgi:hypothetical protein